MKIHKEMTNLEISDLLRAVAASYQLEDEKKNKFRIIAYERAADAVEHLSSETKDLWDEGKLDEIPGVGEAISQHLNEIFRQGKSKHFESLMKNIPPSVFTLMELPRIGVKSAFKLVRGLHLEKSSKVIDDLEVKAEKGLVSQLEGFGKESEADILRAISEKRRMVKRHLLPYALTISEDLINWLKRENCVLKADALGSLRRKVSTVGDIDIAVASKTPQSVIQRFTSYPKATRVIEKGIHTASILLPGNVQVDLMVQNPESYGSLLQHFTGSKHHNIALREYALRKGYSLSEYGIKKFKSKNQTIKTFKDEEKFYNFLGLQVIPPELREDAGEIEAAKDNNLPNLVNLEDIKCDLHLHSDFNIETSHDLGESSMEEMINKANDMGYEYIAFSEHNPSRSMHNPKQFCEILKRKKECIDKINYSLVKSVKIRVNKVYNALEVDILPDGNLAIPEESANYLDFLLVSIHSVFDQKENLATQRVLKALSFEKVKIFSHPTGRKLNEREGIELNWQEIFKLCKERDIWLEIDADPIRLDLPDFLVREAIKNEVKIVLGTDAHSKEGMENMIYGIYVAQRGWVEKNDIINSLNLKEFERQLLK